MNATVVDLRYKTKAILKALDRRESVQILYHGKVKGILIPAAVEPRQSLDAHPFFGSAAQERAGVPDLMKALRGGRYRAL